MEYVNKIAYGRGGNAGEKGERRKREGLILPGFPRPTSPEKLLLVRAGGIGLVSLLLFLHLLGISACRILSERNSTEGNTDADCDCQEFFHVWFDLL
jgi:hypothetical protein